MGIFSYISTVSGLQNKGSFYQIKLADFEIRGHFSLPNFVDFKIRGVFFKECHFSGRYQFGGREFFLVNCSVVLHIYII